jgi:hypothetical protein
MKGKKITKKNYKKKLQKKFVKNFAQKKLQKKRREPQYSIFVSGGENIIFSETPS